MILTVNDFVSKDFDQRTYVSI